jgi:predicted nucleic acid-binding Zn ribbon protein
MAKLSKDFYKMYSLLSAWYGRERAKNEITAYTPKTVSAGDVADKILKKTISPDLLKTIRITESWGDIVGAQIAKVSSPLSFKKKVLYIQVNHSVWLRELTTGPAKGMILKKINALYGEKYCREIKFVPGGR